MDISTGGTVQAITAMLLNVSYGFIGLTARHVLFLRLECVSRNAVTKVTTPVCEFGGTCT